MVHVVQLAVVVCAGGRAQVQVRPAQELGLDLAGPPAGLLAVGLHREGKEKGETEVKKRRQKAGLIKSVLARTLIGVTAGEHEREGGGKGGGKGGGYE